MAISSESFSDNNSQHSWFSVTHKCQSYAIHFQLALTSGFRPLKQHSNSNEFGRWNLHLTNADFSHLHHIPEFTKRTAFVKQNMNQQHCMVKSEKSVLQFKLHFLVDDDLCRQVIRKPLCVYIYSRRLSRQTRYQLHDAVTSLLCCRQALRCGTVSGVGISLPVGGSVSLTGINSLWPAGAVGNFGAGPILAFAML